jgi:hypothetical protein
MDSLVIRVFRATRDSAPQLAAPARAALLLAADRMIADYAGSLSEDTASAANATRVRLQAAGIPFEQNHHGASYVYMHPWLADAYTADSLGPVGQLILLPLLAAGWDGNAACAAKGGSLNGPLVIAHGEAALARGDTNALIHYLLGEAYQDDAALASGAAGGYARASDFRPAATASRSRAIEHYFLALRSLRDPELRVHAWTNATRLMLGARVDPTFACINN